MISSRKVLTFHNIFSTNKLLSVAYSKVSVVEEPLYDVIGPPDPVSNLRKIKFYRDPNETPLEKKYRELRVDTQNWNQEFWNSHNQRFVKERQSFVSKHMTNDRTPLNADEMSTFYKAFLDNNWKLHTNYNLAWYRKNIQLFILAVKVTIERFTRKQIL